MTLTASVTEKSKEALSRAEDLAEDLRDEAVSRVGAAVAATRKAGTALAHDLAERAADTAEYARDLALDRAEAARAAVSDAGVRLADGFRAAADAVPDDLPARSLAAVASGLDTVATSFGGSNLSDLVARTRDFARRNPATFVIGTAVVGYALVRLLKSGSPVAAPVVVAAAAAAAAAEKPVRSAAAKPPRAAKPGVKPVVKAASKAARTAQP